MTATKISEVSANEVAEFLRIIPEATELQTIETVMVAAKSYIKNYTGLSDTEINAIPDLVIAFLVLCQDMYDNRAMMNNASSPNRTVQSILDMHCSCGIVGTDD